jgi:hypothetical protein
MYGRARDWLAAGGAIPRVQRLYDDLLMAETKPTLDGVIQLRAKQDIKDDGFPSPDHADAFVLSFAHEVQRKMKSTDDITAPGPNRNAVVLKEEFDPYGD